MNNDQPQSRSLTLKPCPLCGSEAALNTCRTSDREYIRLNGRDTGHGVNCIRCGLNNRGIAIGYASEQEAADAWNRRAPVSESTTRLPERVWRDTRTVSMDHTMIFGHSYNWEGWQSARKELHTDWGSFAIWPDYLGDKQSRWNVYHDLDGGYRSNLASRDEAEQVALRWLASIPNAPSGERQRSE